jgi:hypothetical protein
VCYLINEKRKFTTTFLSEGFDLFMVYSEIIFAKIIDKLEAKVDVR